MATKAVFDGDEAVWLRFSWFTVGKIDVDGTPIATVTFVVEDNLVIGGVTKVADGFLTVVTVHPTPVISGEASIGEGFFFCSSRHGVS